ncbi:MAG: ABC transporter substrate-binding protein [Beijerinckiaceae bacterium]|nr:ABC transporter substrate-binding protein [Beijerinckiaceae bacterium]
MATEHKVRLKIAIADNPHVAAIKSGAIPIGGVDAEFVTVTPQIAAYRRMVRGVEFDVCELASTTYIIARAYGAPFIALPIFLSRAFHHAGLLVRPDSGISRPTDLEGRKVGVRAYSVTTGAWTRSILADEYGVDLSKVTWVVDDEEHVTAMTLPPNVIHAPEGSSLVEMMETGAIQAGFAGNAGLGRAGAPTAGWEAGKIAATQVYNDLFPNAAELEAAWFRKTGVYPMHGVVVVREGVLREHPWVAKSLMDAFAAAKEDWLPMMRSGGSDSSNDKKYRALSEVVGADPLPFGLRQNMATIDALERLARNQKLIPRGLRLDEWFHEPKAS